MNLGSYLTKSGIQQIQYEAKLALTFLNDSSDRFDDLFLKKVFIKTLICRLIKNGLNMTM